NLSSILAMEYSRSLFSPFGVIDNKSPEVNFIF
ncbi:MAG: hypothetical protein ACI8RP_001726, partial [Urechidicola sp.]